MAMTEKRLARFRRVLEAMEARLRGDLASLEDQARMNLGGGAGGNLSNTPMHLADFGTEQYMQELNATLLENEVYLGAEVRAALARFEQGTFGVCERCGVTIPEMRLEVLPYTRYCTSCSAAVDDGAAVNLNAGRPTGGLGDFERRHGADGIGSADPAGNAAGIADLDQPFTDEAAGGEPAPDIHAAGTAGGGTAIGGLAGTNIGEGDPDDGDLEDALGSSHFDEELDDDHVDTSAYGGPTGGAVGGSIADLRATGGKTGGGIAPESEPGDQPPGP